MKKKSIIFIFALITAFLPFYSVHAEPLFTQVEEPENIEQEEPEDPDSPGPEQPEEKPSVQKNENMRFLVRLNKARLAQKFPPLAVTESMMEAAQIRAEELEKSCSSNRPGSEKKPWYTIFTETGIVKDLSLIEDRDKRKFNVSEFRASGAKTPESMYDAWYKNPSTKIALLRANMTHIGLGHTDGKIKINGKKDTNPWVLLMIGKYEPESIRIKDADHIKTVPKGLSLNDAGLVLELTSISPEGEKMVGDMPVLSEMCTGYDSQKTGEQEVTVTYRYNSKTSLTTTFKINVEKVTPEKPSSFSATGVSYNTVRVQWAPAKDATSYKIYRSTKKKSGYKVIKTLKPADLKLSDDGLYTYSDTNKTSGKMYYYKLRAYAGSVAGKYTSIDEAKPNISAPTGVKAKKTGRTSIKVTWKKVKHATSYRVYYSVSRNGRYKRAGITKKNSLTIRRLSKKRKYYYIKVLPYRKSLPGKYSKTIARKMR